MKRHSTTMNRIAWICTLIITTCSTLSGQITISNHYQNYQSASIGTFQGIHFREAGFSGLYPIPGTDGKEFWTVSDRGVNVDAANANPSACRPTYDKLYAFPWYVPKIHRIRVSGDSIQILETISMKRPDGTSASGIINPTGFGSTPAEVASTDTVLNCNNFNSKTVPKDAWGIDSEGIVVDRNGYFWICEEGGPTIWKLNQQGVVVNRFTPYAHKNGATSYDVQIDSVFQYRKNNRGFEGISITPSGKIYAIIQSPMLYPTKSVGEGTRIHRILEINPTDNSTKMFAYVNDGIIGASGSNQIRLRDWKIGDMAAINDHTFLVIEAALRGTSDFKRIYKIDLENATPVHGGLYNGLTLEALVDSNGLASNGIVPVQKELFMDLLANGWPAVLDKAEGLAIVNDSTIAICNDNDFGQVSPLENGIATATTNLSNLFVFGLSGSNKLPDFVAPCTFFASEISGDQNSCSHTLHDGEAAIYSVWASAGASFKWTLPGNAILVSGQGTNTIEVLFKNGFRDGNIQVAITNGCTDSTVFRSLAIKKTIPAAPVSIVGPSSVCSIIGQGIPATYNVGATDGASAFEWLLPEKVKLISGQGTASVQLVFEEGYVTSSIKVRTVAPCGKSAYQTVKVASMAPIRPGTISGRIYALCDSLNTETYSIQPVPFATGYTWTTSVPGASIISAGTSATITFPPFITGTVSVIAYNDCGASPAKTITIFAKPQRPDAIASEGEICKGGIQTFSVNEVPGATSYAWTVANGNEILSGQGTTSIDVKAWTGGEIKVRSLNGCSISVATYGTINIQSCDSVNARLAQEPNDSEALSIYPVPSRGEVTITFSAKETENFQLVIVDIRTGQVLFTESGISEQGENERQYDFAQLANGLYVIKVKMSGNEQTGKIEIRK